MSLKKINNIFVKLDIRLALIFSLIFIVSSLLLSTITFVTLFTAIQKSDHEAIRQRTLEYWATFQHEGVHGLLSQFQEESIVGTTATYFIRFADSENNTLYINLPPEWESFDYSPLLRSRAPRSVEFIILRSTGERFNLEVTSISFDPGFILQVGKSTENRYILRLVYFRIFSIVFVVLVGFSFLSGFLASSRFLRPMRMLNETVTTIIRTGNMDARIAESGRASELEQFVKSFNLMLDRIQHLIAGMKNTVDNVAHDLKTPITRFRGVAELALQGDGDVETLREALSEGLVQSENIIRMLNTILDIATAETGLLSVSYHAMDISKILREVAELYSFIAEEKQISLETDIPERLTAVGDSAKISQALGNLIDNAIKFSPKDTRIHLQAGFEEESIVIKVTDQGPGIPEADIPYIWDRLYRSGNAKGTQGFGLGLSFVKAIVEAHGGSVQVESVPGKETVFSVILPGRRM